MTTMYVSTISKSSMMNKPKITRKRWTKVELDLLKSLVRADKSNVDIAKRLDRTPLAIYQARMKLGLPRGESFHSNFSRKLTSSKKTTKIFWSSYD